MAKLVWGNAGSRRFESGVDRGVLFLPDGSGVAWNGLTSVDDDTSDLAVEPYYLDGVKYMNRRGFTDYSGTLKAFTYPDEFLPFDGYNEFDNGLVATGQPVKGLFSLSYRTRVGNDLNASAGYKIHLLYNLTAIPENKTFTTLQADANIDEFSWKITGVPINIPGMRPTSHLIIDSTRVLPLTMTALETYLYGNDLTDGALPDAAMLMQLQLTANP